MGFPELGSCALEGDYALMYLLFYGCRLCSKGLVSLLALKDVCPDIQPSLPQILGIAGGSFLGCALSTLGCLLSSNLRESASFGISLSSLFQLCSEGCALRSCFLAEKLCLDFFQGLAATCLRHMPLYFG